MQDDSTFYDELKSRPPSPIVRLAALVLPGVRTTRAQVLVYAEDWKRSNEQALKASGPLWVVMGDSMAQGVGAGAYDRGWVGQLDKILRSDGKDYRILNLSISGGRAEDVLDKQLPALEQLGLKPDLITVFIGMNNLSRKKNRAHLSENLSKIIDRLPKGSVIATLAGRPQLVGPINNMIRQQAPAHGLIVAEMEGIMKPPFKDQLAVDFFHPNENGYAVYAKAFAQALKY